MNDQRTRASWRLGDAADRGEAPASAMHRRAFIATASAAAAGLVLGGSTRAARADETNDVLASIAKARAGLKTLVAPFTQERTVGLLATTVRSEGELTLVMPDALRWELKPPDAITYWVTKQGFAYSTKSGSASAGKSAAGRFGAVLNDMLVLLGGDLTKLAARYELSAKKTSTGGVKLTLTPKADEVKKHLARLELVATSELWSPDKITIEEKGGDQSVITFTKITRDAKVDPAKMKPPK